MTDMKVGTAPVVELFDAERVPPPKGITLLVLSRYGVLTKGLFQPDFHVAWAYLPKIPSSVRERMANFK